MDANDEEFPSSGGKGGGIGAGAGGSHMPQHDLLADATTVGGGSGVGGGGSSSGLGTAAGNGGGGGGNDGGAGHSGYATGGGGTSNGNGYSSSFAAGAYDGSSSSANHVSVMAAAAAASGGSGGDGDKKPKKKEKSIYKGVFRCGNKFKAQIQTNGVQHYLGLFDDEKEAARAYDAHARMVLGPRAKTNLEYKDDELPELAYAASVGVPLVKKETTNGTVVAVPAPGVTAPLGLAPPNGAAEKVGGVTKRVYVGIKARQKRPPAAVGDGTSLLSSGSGMGSAGGGGSGTSSGMGSSSSGGSSSSSSSSSGGGGGRSGRSMVEAIADNMRDSGSSNKRQRTGGGLSPVHGGSGGGGGNMSIGGYPAGSSSSGHGGIDLMGMGGTDFMSQNNPFFGDAMALAMGMGYGGDGSLQEEDFEADWRDQIYYWTGLLSFDAENSCLMWKGSWLGSFTGKPQPEEFAWSTNEFEYSGQQLGADDVYSQGLLRPKSGYFKGYYLMDNDGSGNLEKYLDNEYYVEFEEVRGLHPPRYTVIGKGESDFGTFVLTGTYNAGNRVLEMARQYIAEDDERCQMDIEQLKQHLIAAAAAAGTY